MAGKRQPAHGFGAGLASLDTRVGALEGRVANVEAETRGQTATLHAIKENSDTLVKQAIESAEERGRRKQAEEDRHKRATDAETKLKTWQRVAVPLGIAAPFLAALLTWWLAHR